MLRVRRDLDPATTAAPSNRNLARGHNEGGRCARLSHDHRVPGVEREAESIHPALTSDQAAVDEIQANQVRVRQVSPRSASSRTSSISEGDRVTTSAGRVRRVGFEPTWAYASRF